MAYTPKKLAEAFQEEAAIKLAPWNEAMLPLSYVFQLGYAAALETPT